MTFNRHNVIFTSPMGYNKDAVNNDYIQYLWLWLWKVKGVFQEYTIALCYLKLLWTSKNVFLGLVITPETIVRKLKLFDSSITRSVALLKVWLKLNKFYITIAQVTKHMKTNKICLMKIGQGYKKLEPVKHCFSYTVI